MIPLKKLVIGLYLLAIFIIVTGIFIYQTKDKKEKPNQEISFEETLKTVSDTMSSLENYQSKTTLIMNNQENQKIADFSFDTLFDKKNNQTKLVATNHLTSDLPVQIYSTFDSKTETRVQQMPDGTTLELPTKTHSNLEIDPFLLELKNTVLGVKENDQYQFHTSTKTAKELVLTGIYIGSMEDQLKIFEETTISLSIDTEHKIIKYTLEVNALIDEIPVKVTKTVEYSNYNQIEPIHPETPPMSSTKEKLGADTIYGIIDVIRSDYSNMLLDQTTMPDQLIVTCNGEFCAYENGTHLLLTSTIPSSGTITMDIKTNTGFTGSNIQLYENTYHITNGEVLLS